MTDIDAARQYWHPIAASDDLPFRHVFHAQLLGRELALWRADDGNVNAWENRCLHRGVRLSIGINDGTELVCQYHGWRYANRTAGCTYIPAHPADAPARTICNNTYPVMERSGLVWCKEQAGNQPLNITLLSDAQYTLPLFAIPVNATLDQTGNGLMSSFAATLLKDTTDIANSLVRIDAYTLSIDTATDRDERCILFLQPADAGRTIIRGLVVLHDAVTDVTKMQTLRRYSDALNRCRRRIESLATQEPSPGAWQATIKPVSELNSTLPEFSGSGEQAPLRLRVTQIDNVARAIKSFRFETIRDQIPSAQPGAHIDIHLPNGLVRQYSLINGPGETDHYAIAVKHVPDSKGGSLWLHETIKVGDVVASSLPRNNFSLRRDAEHTHLIAGGIGITPLLSMARALHRAALPFTLHYFVTDEQDIVFKQELEALRGASVFHLGLSAEQTQDMLQEILSTPHADQHIYLCGPDGMLTSAISIAQQNGWSDPQVHFEYFKNTTSRNTASSFTVELARSGLTLDVPGGKTLLQVLRENTVFVASSCEQGACGTCKVTVLDGTPDHQDVHLSATEKARGDCMMSCVSRAKSGTLILDL